MIYFHNKAELLQEGIFFLIHLFAVVEMKKLEIEKTKPTFIISVLKVEYWVHYIENYLSCVSLLWDRSEKETKIVPTSLRQSR